MTTDQVEILFAYLEVIGLALWVHIGWLCYGAVVGSLFSLSRVREQ